MELTVKIPTKMEENWKHVTQQVTSIAGHDIDAEILFEALTVYQLRKKQTNRIQQLLKKVRKKSETLKKLPKKEQLQSLGRSMDALQGCADGKI